MLKRRKRTGPPSIKMCQIQKSDDAVFWTRQELREYVTVLVEDNVFYGQRAFGNSTCKMMRYMREAKAYKRKLTAHFDRCATPVFGWDATAQIPTIPQTDETKEVPVPRLFVFRAEWMRGGSV